MLFSSISFLYVFLPAVLFVYYMTPNRFKNVILLLSSLLFYFWGEPVYTILLVGSSVSDFFHSLWIERFRGTRRAKALLISSIIVNLSLLGFFKYADFCISIANTILGSKIPLTNIPLPIGISFFTFQTMSYTVDVYRGRVRANFNLLTFAAYVCLFPQLIAGPIVRYSDIEAELKSRRIPIDSVAAGMQRFTFGLAKKVWIANIMGEICAVFQASGEKTILFYWLYAIAFTLQIYFDFSGYSDMAIGLGRMFGFSFPENFDYPYMSRSITEFWRRWHMTLGGWFRDYVYIPLGGNRVSNIIWLRNVMLVWLLTGLWHGAAWNFIIWGLMFGILLILEKFFLADILVRSGRILPHVYVLIMVIISFVIFNADGLSGALSDLSGMFGCAAIPLWNAESWYYFRSYGVSLILAVLGATTLPRRMAGRMTFLEPFAVAVLLLGVTASLVDGSFNPFLYFRF